MPRTIGDGNSTFADSTLMTMSKKDLIHTIRLLEKNLRSAKEQNDRQYKMLISRENAFAKGYAQGKEDAIEDFATNIGECKDCKSAVLYPDNELIYCSENACVMAFDGFCSQFERRRSK